MAWLCTQSGLLVLLLGVVDGAPLSSLPPPQGLMVDASKHQNPVVSVIFERTTEGSSAAARAFKEELQKSAAQEQSRMVQARAHAGKTLALLHPMGRERGPRESGPAFLHASSGRVARGDTATESTSDHQVTLRPPVESATDVTEALDALAKVEDTKRVSAEEEFSSEKQQLLEREQTHIRDIVRGAPGLARSGHVRGVFRGAQKSLGFLQLSSGDGGLPDYQVTLHPPAEAVADVADALDALVKSEETKRLSAEEEFAHEKQHLLDEEKLRIRDLVQGVP